MRMRFFFSILLLGAGLFAVGCDCGGNPTADAGPDGPAIDAPVTRGCGDGFVRDTEVCDDGNTTPGDGCSADCMSDETCGNATIDMGVVGELCDDGNTTDGDACRGDCLSDYRCGNMVVDTVASGASVDEACDDGNTVNGDGCSAACDSDETCGNDVIDPGEACDDGNTSGGDDCSADCSMSLLCGNGTIEPPEDCDDNNVVSGDACSDTCQTERCGNGRVDFGEDCDDGNTVNGDGCGRVGETLCTFTCGSGADCADGNICNGTETCMNAGTATSSCAAGANAGDGTLCGGPASGLVCMGGVCVTAGCGDGGPDGGEACDDGNNVSGDGCSADCMSDETCGNSVVDTIAGEVCDDGGTSNGGACRGDCRSDYTCGNRIVDVVADGGPTNEECDDGNVMVGDGCSATCTVEPLPPTGFRVTSMELVSPRVVVDVPLGGCQDITNMCASVPFLGCQADALNVQLQDAIDPVSAGGTYALHIVNLFRPLSPGAATTQGEVHFNAVCSETPTPDSCGPAGSPTEVAATLRNLSLGTCFAPIAADVNTRAGTPSMYTPGVNTVSGPCYISDPTTVSVTLSGITIPLQDARVAATYSGSPVSSLVSGVIVGFLTEQDAADITIPTTLPLVGGDSLYTVLQAGNRTAMNTAGQTIADGCNIGGATSANEDDGDMHNGQRGFWFFLNFTAQRVTWTGS